MKLLTKIISMALVLFMFTGLVACSGNGNENSSAEYTSSEESSLTDEERAAELYENAISALEDKADIKQELTAKVIRTVAKDVFEIETKRTVVRIDGGFYANEKTEVDSKVIKSESFFKNGKYMYVSDEEKYYYKEMDAKSAEGLIEPIMLLNKELYESLSFDGEDESTLVLSNATAAEKWMAPEYASVKTAEGKIKLNDDGEISAYEYTAEYTQGIAQYKAEYKATLSAPEEDDKVELPEADAVELDSIELIDILDIAYIATARLTSFDFGKKFEAASQPGGVSFSSEENIYTYGDSEKDFLAKTTIDQKYVGSQGQVQEQSVEQSYKDGKLTTIYEGQESTVSSSMKEILDGVINGDEELSLMRPDMTLFESYELKDLGSYWYISYKLNEEGGKKYEDYLSEFFFGDSNAVDEVADAYKTEKADLYISIDKDALIITAAGIDFECIHTVDGTDYKSIIVANTSYAIGSVSTYKEITGELPAEEEPEEKARPLFYKVTSSEGKTMYLFGTIHVGDSRTAYLPDEIYDALEDSDALAVEINIPKYEAELETNPDLLGEYLKSYYYSDNSLIKNHISEELYNEALPYVLTSGAYAYTANYMTPYAWYDYISHMYMGSNPHLSYYFGVDLRLIRMANDKDIKIYDIEDPKEHLCLPNKFSEKITEMLLKEIVGINRHEYIGEQINMYEMWCSGDEKALTDYILSNDYPEDAGEEELAAMKDYDKLFIADRDALMFEKAKEYLSSDETVFFAVGLAHLLSETGLVNALRAEGYTVELIEYAK